MSYRETIVFRKHNAGRPQCLGNAIQNIILPQTGLQPKSMENCIQGDHCVWETLYKETNVFGPHDPNHVVDVIENIP